MAAPMASPTAPSTSGCRKAVQLLEYEIGSGQDVELKNFAAEILPAVLRHLRSAQDLQAEMSGKAH
jgi:putative membrane protein